MNVKEVGRVIRFHRKKAGLSQQELAKVAGLGKTVIFDIEHSKTSIRFDTLFKVLEVLNIRIVLDSPLIKLYQHVANEKS